MSDVLTERTAAGVLLITLNRPEKLNTLSETLYAEFHAAMADAMADPAVRVVAVTGAGRAFCAGADLSGRRDADPAAPRRGHLGTLNFMTHHNESFPGPMYGCRKPTLALVNGPAAGGGMGLSLAADFRIAARSAIFVSAFARIGLAGDTGITYGLSRLVGRAKALEILMLSPRLSAEEALAIGLVRQVVDDDELLSVGMEFADKLAAGPTEIFALMKDNLDAIELMSYDQALHKEATGIAISGSTGASAAAMRAFLEKREPDFR